MILSLFVYCAYLIYSADLKYIEDNLIVMIDCLNPDYNFGNSDDNSHCQQCNSILLINDRYGAIKEICMILREKI